MKNKKKILARKSCLLYYLLSHFIYILQINKEPTTGQQRCCKKMARSITSLDVIGQNLLHKAKGKLNWRNARLVEFWYLEGGGL